MLSVGFGGSIHDYATVVADSKALLIGIEDERLTRVRHARDASDPLRPSFDYCTKAHAEAALPATERCCNDTLMHCPIIQDSSCVVIGHHYAHAMSSFFTSQFDEAAVLVIDGAGSAGAVTKVGHLRETSTLFHGYGNTLKTIATVNGEKLCPQHINSFDHPTSNSVGDFYEAITCAAGFAPLQEGKTMALAAYGDDRYVGAIGACIDLGEGFDYTIRLFGRGGLLEILDSIKSARVAPPVSLPFDEAAAIAYAGQYHLEHLVQHLLSASHALVPTDSLCIVGGVALNAVLIGKIPSVSPYTAIHCVPAPSDSGTAVGAALHPHVLKAASRSPKRWAWPLYLGASYPKFRASVCRSYTQVSSLTAEAAAEEVWKCLDYGKVAAVFRGGSEFGPRALGHRSLLALPSTPGIQSRINSIKSREWFRPVAPMVTKCGHPGLISAERLMQSARHDARSILASRASLHVDGSARVQVIDSESDNFLRHLLHIAQRNGSEAVLNTSFNTQGQPLVETPSDALETFENSEIDALLLEDTLLLKTPHQSYP